MTTEAHTIETAPAPRPTAGSRRTAVVAIVVVALAAAGAALAASRFHGSSSSTAGGPGGGGGFAPAGQTQDGQGPGGFGPGGGFRDRDRGPRGLGGLSAAADYLGIPVSTLFSDLQSGKTLAQVAQASSGKTVQGLVDAMVAAEKAQLKSAVSSGRLSQAQAEQLGAAIESRITDMVNGGFRGPRGFGPPQSRPTPGVTL